MYFFNVDNIKNTNQEIEHLLYNKSSKKSTINSNRFYKYKKLRDDKDEIIFLYGDTEQDLIKNIVLDFLKR